MRRRKEERIEIHERLIIRTASGLTPASRRYRDLVTLNEVVQQHYHARKVVKTIILLFSGSFLVTAVFSASLKVFFQEVSWREVLVKGLLIPCFTWTVQLLLSAIFLKTEDRLTYWNRLGWVCLIGSIALLPAAFYNLGITTPWVWVSVLNVLASVVLMAVTLHFLLRRAGFRWLWTLSWIVLIVINMSLYLSSVL